VSGKRKAKNAHGLLLHDSKQEQITEKLDGNLEILYLLWCSVI